MRVVTVLVVLDEVLCRHLVVAVGRHIEVLRRDGMPVPGEVYHLFEVLAASGTATSGLQRPELAAGPAGVDAVAVGYVEAGRRLGVSGRTVRRWVRRGRLRAVEAGRRRLVPVVELARFAEGGEST